MVESGCRDKELRQLGWGWGLLLGIGAGGSAVGGLKRRAAAAPQATVSPGPKSPSSPADFAIAPLPQRFP